MKNISVHYYENISPNLKSKLITKKVNDKLTILVKNSKAKFVI